MKKLFTLIVLALAFSACQTAPKADPTTKDLLQGNWKVIGTSGQIITFTSDKIEAKLSDGTVATTRWFETHIKDMDGRSWAVFTNATSSAGAYASGNKMSVRPTPLFVNITGDITPYLTFTKQ